MQKIKYMHCQVSLHIQNLSVFQSYLTFRYFRLTGLSLVGEKEKKNIKSLKSSKVFRKQIKTNNSSHLTIWYEYSFPFGQAVRFMGSQSLNQGLNPGPRLWKLRALTKRPWGKSRKCLYLGSLWPWSIGACWWQDDVLHFQAVLSMTRSSFIQRGIQNSGYKKEFQERTQSRVQAGSRGQWLRA